MKTVRLPERHESNIEDSVLICVMSGGSPGSGKASGQTQHDTAADGSLHALHQTYRESTLFFVMTGRQGGFKTWRSRRLSPKDFITSLVMNIFKMRVLRVLTGILRIVRSKESSNTKNQVWDCLTTNCGTDSFTGRLAVHCLCYLLLPALCGVFNPKGVFRIYGNIGVDINSVDYNN